jgi:hypothetical protein
MFQLSTKATIKLNNNKNRASMIVPIQYGIDIHYRTELMCDIRLLLYFHNGFV